MEKVDKRVRVTEKTIKRLNKYRAKKGKVDNDFIINEGLDELNKKK